MFHKTSIFYASKVPAHFRFSNAHFCTFAEVIIFQKIDLQHFLKFFAEKM